MIMIVDYGLGNIQAIRNIYEQLNIEAEVAKTIDQLERADKIILPGVGAFDWAMECLGASAWLIVSANSLWRKNGWCLVFVWACRSWAGGVMKASLTDWVG